MWLLKVLVEGYIKGTVSHGTLIEYEIRLGNNLMCVS